MKTAFFSKRILSGLLAGLFGLAIVGLGGWWFTIAVGLIVHFALVEFFRMAEFTGIRPATKTTLVACQLLLLSTQLGIEGQLSLEMQSAVLPIAGVVICAWLLFQPITGSIADIAASIFGLFYLGFLPSYWIKIRNLTEIDFNFNENLTHLSTQDFFSLGMKLTLASCLMIVASDIGSYLFGRLFGKNPLSPISPSKTIEGAIGGMLCAVSVGSISGVLFAWERGLLFGFLLGTIVGLFSVVGDLIESMMKRDAGLKDSGNILPGHGGILDRIDSYLFAPAIIFYMLVLILPLFNK